MSMFLKNYTSEVPVGQTIYRIEQVLIRCGVNGITKEYDDQGQVTALIFHVKLDRVYTIRLPADVEAAWGALWKDYLDGDKEAQMTNGDCYVCYNARKRKRKSEFKEQALRTAWKLQQDWVEVQMSMIQLKQAEFLQVFVGYLWDGKRTYYDALRAGGFAALPAPKEEGPSHG